MYFQSLSGSLTERLGDLANTLAGWAKLSEPLLPQS